MSRRVLQVVPSLGGAGAETQLGYLSQGLVVRGWQVDVGILKAGPNLERFRASGARLHRIASRSNYDPRLIVRLVRLIRRLDPALVVTWIPMMDVLGGIAARIAGVPWILTERNQPQMFPTTPKTRLRVLIARGAAHVVSNSVGGDEYWSARLPSGVPRSVIGNALPLDEIASAERAPRVGRGLDEDAPLIVFVGRLSEVKNVENVVEALSRVARATDAVAVLCGTGPLEDQVRGWVAERGMEGRICVAGFTPEAIGLLKRAVLSISLSRCEGMPNAIMEAMAVGCPLVVSDIPAHRAILDEQTAKFVDLEDPGAAALAMIDVLERPRAAAERAARARESSAAWSIDSVARAYERIFDQVLDDPRVRS